MEKQHSEQYIRLCRPLLVSDRSWGIMAVEISCKVAKLKVQSFLRTGLDVLRSQIETRQSALCAAAASSLGYTTTPCPMSWSTYLPTFQSNASPFHQLLISEAQL